jgi:hypothetical protein
MNTYKKLLIALVGLFLASVAPVRAQSVVPFFNSGTVVGNDANGNAISYQQSFGYYTLDFFPYVYKYNNFGYLYYLGNNTSSEAYFLDFTTGDFFYTNPSLYPYFYSFNLKTFLYYFEGTTPRTFYNFSTQKFIVY